MANVLFFETVVGPSPSLQEINGTTPPLQGRARRDPWCARESVFSGLNNVAAYSLLRTEFSTCFGFTEPEVEALLGHGDAAGRIEDVRRAYNGYVFGNATTRGPC